MHAESKHYETDYSVGNKRDRPLIAELLMTGRFADYYRRNELYQGAFKVEETQIGKVGEALFRLFTIPFMLLSLFFVELKDRFKKENKNVKK